MSQNEKKHHFLIAGQVVFAQTVNGEEVVNAIPLNGVLITDRQELPVASLGKAQQILQLNFVQRMQDDSLKVVDVVLLNFVHLGHMTKAEFEAAPGGLKVVEKDPRQQELDLTGEADAAGNPANQQG